MEQIRKTPKRAGQGGHESLFALFMIALLLFEIILIGVVMARALHVDADTGRVPPFDGETTSEPEDSETDTPTPDIPVFAGATLPKKPYSTGTTATVSGLFSQYAVLVNAETGEIVVSDRSSACFAPASMTKVMTLIVACERLRESELDLKLTMTQELHDYVRSGSYAGTTNYGIDVGDEYVLRDLLYGIGMKSASDCVMSVVLHLSESEEAFVELMNQKVAELGLQNTHFDNAIGYDSENNYTTPEDLAVIMAYAMQSDLIRDILGRETYAGQAAGYNKEGVFVPSFPITFYSTLFGKHEGSRMQAYQNKYGTPFTLKTASLLAGKTGMTTQNYCLVSYAQGQDGTRYVVVLGAANGMHETMKDLKTVLDTYVK